MDFEGSREKNKNKENSYMTAAAKALAAVKSPIRVVAFPFHLKIYLVEWSDSIEAAEFLLGCHLQKREKK